MQRQQEALAASDAQLASEQEDGAPDRVVGMKAKRESEEEIEEDGVEWEEQAGMQEKTAICFMISRGALRRKYSSIRAFVLGYKSTI